MALDVATTFMPVAARGNHSSFISFSQICRLDKPKDNLLLLLLALAHPFLDVRCSIYDTLALLVRTLHPATAVHVLTPSTAALHIERATFSSSRLHSLSLTQTAPLRTNCFPYNHRHNYTLTYGLNFSLFAVGSRSPAPPQKPTNNIPHTNLDTHRSITLIPFATTHT